ncbi:MAG: galactokinase [Anaerolineaceae bacterium]|nr:galactokinase [Anaerolineaceae bacterium]
MQKPSTPIHTTIAPGRVNLLGEHVDYNDGIVLPAAIDRHVTLTFHMLDEPVLHLHALDLNKSIAIPLDNLEAKIDTEGEPLQSFALYPASVAWALQQAGLTVPGMHASYTSNVPIGAGLSSSAAVEVAFAVSWQYLAEWNIPKMTLAQHCQRGENRYVGVQSGLMDQFASLFGIENHALMLDTRSLDWQPLGLPEDIAIIIADSKVRRSLSGSTYNNRRNDCREALQQMASLLPGIKALRDLSIDQFNEHAHILSNTTRLRAKHVVYECARVDKAVEFLNMNDAESFGHLMFECHQSLRDNYEVSCPELDVLVEIAAKQEGCLGARLTGAGFGGCTVNLVKQNNAELFIANLKKSYRNLTGKDADVYLCQAAAGAAVVE